MIKVIHNTETGEITEVEMTPEEIAQCEADVAEHLNRKEQRAAQEEQRQKILDRLRLTEEEAQLLLGGN